MKRNPIPTHAHGSALETQIGVALATQHSQTKILNRLRRLEGQVRGLQKMLEDERACAEILSLLSGVRSALDSTGEFILERYLRDCRAAPADDIKGLLEVVRLMR